MVHAHVRHRRAATVALAALAASSLAVGCATATSSQTTPPVGDQPAPSPVVVQDKSNGHTVSVKVGQRLELILASNYWTVRGSSVPGVLRQDGQTRDLPKPPGCGSIPGIGCVPIRTDFSALAPGTAVITASRVSCGEAMRCSPAQQHFTVTIVVR